MAASDDETDEPEDYDRTCGDGDRRRERHVLALAVDHHGHGASVMYRRGS